jgi:hypothetical protein
MKRSERGDGKIGLFILVILLAIIIFVLIKVVPARINAYEFKDYMEAYARQDSWSRTPDQMKKDLAEKARFLNLNITEKDISIDKAGANIAIHVVFDVPVDLKVHTWVLHYDFTQQAEHF